MNKGAFLIQRRLLSESRDGPSAIWVCEEFVQRLLYMLFYQTSLVYPKTPAYVFQVIVHYSQISSTVENSQLASHRVEFSYKLSLEPYPIGVGSDGIEVDLSGHAIQKIADLTNPGQFRPHMRTEWGRILVERAIVRRQSQTTRDAPLARS
jgi:hypothetical protein